MSEVEIVIRGMCCGVLLAMALVVLQPDARNPARWTLALFCLATAGFVVQTGGRLADIVGPVRYAAWLLSAGGTAYFWLFAATLFTDNRFGGARLLPALLMTAIATIGRMLGPTAQIGTETVHNMFEVVLVLHVLYLVRQSAQDDLVSARNSLRRPFIISVALFCILLSALDILWTLGIRDAWMKLGQAIALLAMSLAGAWTFLQASPALFGQTLKADTLPDTRGKSETTDTSGLDRLRELMDSDAFWRQPGLTLADTAKQLALPEYRLRRLIHHHLGFRNFPDLVNAQRIAQAKLLLADPLRSTEQVSSIAFDLGFASLGPFNRAFKAATQLSPSQWREQQALGRLKDEGADG